MTELALAPWGDSLAEWVQAAAAAERAGMRAVFSNELHRSAFVPLAAAAPATSSITLASGIALAFVRSPLVTALEALDLDELCGGRLVLGLGTGVRRLVQDWHRAGFEAPAQRLAETVAAIRAVIAGAAAGEPIQAGGELAGTSITGWARPYPPPRAAIPIYLAAMGPRLLELAGELADGWIAHELGSPAHLAAELAPRLDAGLARAGRDRSALTRVASACCVPWPDRAEAHRLAAHQIAFYASVRTYEDFFGWHGFAEQARACQQAFRAGDTEAMLAAVTPEMVATLTLTGTPEEVADRLSSYDGVADVVKLGPPTYHGDPALTRAVQGQILALASRAH